MTLPNVCIHTWIFCTSKRNEFSFFYLIVSHGVLQPSEITRISASTKYFIGILVYVWVLLCRKRKEKCLEKIASGCWHCSFSSPRVVRKHLELFKFAVRISKRLTASNWDDKYLLTHFARRSKQLSFIPYFTFMDGCEWGGSSAPSKDF